MDTQTVTMDSESNSAQQEAMEEKLAQFLSRMEGAGRVEVLITYASTEEQVIEKETPSVTNSQTSENDAGGTSRVIPSPRVRKTRSIRPAGTVVNTVCDPYAFRKGGGRDGTCTGWGFPRFEEEHYRSH